MSDSEKSWMAREVAALASEGMDTTHIWMRLDLSASEVEEIYALPEFETAMRERGDDLWEVWSLSRAEDKSRHTIHQKILQHADEYWQELHKIALSGEKVEARTRILLSFLESTKQLGPDLDVGDRISLSPMTIRQINRGDEVFERHPSPIIEPEDSDVPGDQPKA